MSRRRRQPKRETKPDPKFGTVELSVFIRKVMLGGKLTTAQRIVYDALDRAESEAHRPGIEVFQQALRNCMPVLEVKSRRVGGATYQVPQEVGSDRQTALAMRWLIAEARSRTGRPMSDRLAQELLEASRGQGAAVKRKEDLYRMAEANRAYVHYRW
jgi:small subunit ribosomal protein S7